MAREAAVHQGVWVAIRILVVDDSQHFRRVVHELLMLRGFEVVDVAADGEDALAAVVRDCPDGVLLDINLPGRDGYAVSASLASVCPAATIVLTSSDVDGVSPAVLGECGATAFVPKTELATVDLRRLFSGEGFARLDERDRAGPPGT
jgi:two-component system, chemotaxis family, protein-glutamate methylesterase/glutaminase